MGETNIERTLVMHGEQIKKNEREIEKLKKLIDNIIKTNDLATEMEGN